MNWAPLLLGGGAALKRGALIAGHLQDGAIRGDCRKLTYDSNFSYRLFWYVFLRVVSSKSWENHVKTTSQWSGRRNLPPSFVTASQLVFLAENEDEIIMVAR